jgi:deoxyribonuclease IV
MLIGGHVSTAGGLAKAHERGVEFGCDAIQVFNQSPRMWRPTAYKQADIDAFRDLMANGPIRSVVIHAVYLINAASKDPEVREKSLRSLVHALRVGDAIGADGVVFHPGSTVGEPLEEALERAGEAIRHVLAESERCPLLLEDTAGAGGTLGRSFEELRRLIELAGGDERIGVCLDCCHLLASGYDVRTIDGVGAVVDEYDALVGLERLRCLHINDSQMALGSNRDRHASLPNGELGEAGLAAFLSEPRFDGLPALLEGPGLTGKGTDGQQIAVARELRKKGLAARRRRAKARPASRKPTRARRG